MPTSIRLDPQAERLLRRLARARRQTKSEVVRDAIRTLARELEGSDGPASVYDRVAHVIGIADSGGAALSEDTGAKFRALLADRPRVRRTR
jgi:predicted DNA-binding protein